MESTLFNESYNGPFLQTSTAKTSYSITVRDICISTTGKIPYVTNKNVTQEKADRTKQQVLIETQDS